MKKEEIEDLIAKYRKKSSQELRYGADKCAYFERVADNIEDNLHIYIDDDFYKTEEDILDDVNEGFAEIDDFYDDEDLINNIF